MAWQVRFQDPDPDFDQCFTTAVELASDELLSILKDLESQWRGKQALTEKVLKRDEDHPSGRVLVFEKYTRWNRVMSEVEKELDIEGEILLIVNPRQNDKKFVVCAVFKRFLFPKEWGGVRDEELKKLTGLAGAKFVHMGLHLAILDNKEDALSLVNMMMERRHLFVSERDSLIEKVKEMRVQGENMQREVGTERASSSKTVDIWRPGHGSWTERRQRMERRGYRDGRGGNRLTPHS